MTCRLCLVLILLILEYEYGRSYRCRSRFLDSTRSNVRDNIVTVHRSGCQLTLCLICLSISQQILTFSGGSLEEYDHRVILRIISLFRQDKLIRFIIGQMSVTIAFNQHISRAAQGIFRCITKLLRVIRFHRKELSIAISGENRGILGCNEDAIASDRLNTQSKRCVRYL